MKFPRSCDSRKYTYFFPSYVLIPPKPGSGLDRVLRTGAPPLLPPLDESSHPFWAGEDDGFTAKEDDLIGKRQWRISPNQLELLREMVKRYEGTVSDNLLMLDKQPDE
jgi:tRNA pseudouridine38-40 synthase